MQTISCHGHTLLTNYLAILADLCSYFLNVFLFPFIIQDIDNEQTIGVI